MKAHERPTTKICNICHEEKPLDCFSKGRRQCKPCRVKREQKRMANPEVRDRALAKKRAHHHANKERMNEISRQYYQDNRERMIESQKERDALRWEDKLEYQRQHYHANRKRVRKYQAKYFRNNRHIIAAKDSKRRAAKLNAYVPWADQEKIRAIYQEAQEKTKSTGIQHHVDHIIPLQGKNICGLHVETNLQVITEKENLRKSNNFG